MQRFDEGEEFSIVLYQAGGKTFFPIAENIGFRGSLGDFNTPEQGAAALNELMDWSMTAAGEATQFQSQIVVAMLDAYFPNLKRETTTPLVEERFIIREEQRPPGIFFIRGKPPRRKPRR